MTTIGWIWVTAIKIALCQKWWRYGYDDASGDNVGGSDMKV